MGIGRTYSAQITGTSACIVRVEVTISKGLNSITLVGMGDKAVQESIERISSALVQSGIKSPRTMGARIVISLAPSEIRKTGTGFDLPILIAYLLAARLIPNSSSVSKTIFIGEVGLDGSILPTLGILPKAIAARSNGFETIIAPPENACEANHIPDISICEAHNVQEVIDHFKGKVTLIPLVRSKQASSYRNFSVTLNDIKGNPLACRVLEIAATGRHNLLLFGEPGGGKTLMASAIPSILPPLSHAESLEVTSLHSIAGHTVQDLIRFPPFRNPHHTSSYTSIIGGGIVLRPGEISLAHNGVLFMDEFPLFGKRVINTLREPLESQNVTIARSSGNATFPADFMLVAAMNPLDNQKKNEHKAISSAILDRFDLSLEIPRTSYRSLLTEKAHTTSESVLERVITARTFAKASRLILTPINSRIKSTDIQKYCNISPATSQCMQDISDKLNLSLRGVIKSLRVARTIADLEQSSSIEKEHLYEALSLRSSNSP